MKITGQSTLDASVTDVWPLIFDPRALLELLPGCDGIEQIAPDEFRARMNLRIPALAGAYDGRVKVLEADAPRFCRMEGEVSGTAGSVRGQASFTLEPVGGQTYIEYGGDALITGFLASMNPRFAEGVAQTLIRQGLARLPQLIHDRAAAVVAPAPVAVRAVPVWRARFAIRVATLQRGLARFVGRVRFRHRS